MLKEVIDETSHGKYDFMYLRIGTSRVWFGLCHKSSSQLMITQNKQIMRTVASQLHIDISLVWIAHLFVSVGYAFINFENVRIHWFLVLIGLHQVVTDSS